MLLKVIHTLSMYSRKTCAIVYYFIIITNATVKVAL